MAIKTLKIKRVFAYTIHRGLKAVPPKDYPSTGEIKTTLTDILPVLKPFIDEYYKLSVRAEEVTSAAVLKEITDEKTGVVSKIVSDEPSKVKLEEINAEWKKYSKEHGDEIVAVALDGEGFKTLKAQFDRENWGKTWVVNIEEFSELMEAFAAAEK